MDFQNGERSDPGVPVLPNSLHHYGGRSGKVDASISLQTAGSTDCVGMGDIRDQHSVLCGKRPHSGP